MTHRLLYGIVKSIVCLHHLYLVFYKVPLFYFLGISGCRCKIEDVPDIEMREKLEEIEASIDEHQFASILNNFPQRYECGYLTYEPKFTEKAELVQKISHHCIISANIEEIQQFSRGLATAGMLQMMKENTTEAKKLLMYDENLVDVEKVKKLFEPHFSNNTVDAALEEDIVFNLYNFLEEIAHGKVKSVDAFTLTLVEDGCTDESKKVEKDVKISDVIQFFTGYRYYNTLSKKIDVHFKHGQKGRIVVNTCNYLAFFPVSEMYTGKNFTNNIVSDIINSPGFGHV